MQMDNERRGSQKIDANQYISKRLTSKFNVFHQLPLRCPLQCTGMVITRTTYRRPPSSGWGAYTIIHFRHHHLPRRKGPLATHHCKTGHSQREEVYPFVIPISVLILDVTLAYLLRWPIPCSAAEGASPHSSKVSLDVTGCLVVGPIRLFATHAITARITLVVV